ncbi:hypothetical protein LOTGIDRAFT_231659 [Lottia gigantea]|uniref:TIR domain-containing protein n=1 Tax=Lottia gigantea TaxID=225164 RepID=V3ZZ45_LOTGI|nr:hypothetical protein LOTGIDRAFT_231659 [Lottia gigantea]ESO96823.1 hypothetical protein LOTGIDRAFT_231659 [Lottia gigantea]
MADEDEDEPWLIGVNLLSECGKSVIKLGLVVLPKEKKYTLNQLRKELSKQLPSLPACYSFCTKQRLPISEGHESQFKIDWILSEDQTLFIKQKFDKPKIGVKLNSGLALGSIFINYNSRLSQLRTLIFNEIELSDRFIFIDNNGWPVRKNQEERMIVSEVVNESCITLSPDIIYLENHLSTADYNDNSLLSDTPPRKKIKRMKELTFCTSKDNTYKSSCSSVESVSIPSKQLLISYVRAEAAQHALDLKQQLSSLGFSVYLDVHEIKSGVDWQDSLNYAVSNCQIFLPLITPRYGETQWTNREVKLADVLGKYILPINFLDTWPPRCLAIQFATTQYIAWKTLEQLKHDKITYGEERANDIGTWNDEYIAHVAKSIANRLEQLVGMELERLPSLTRRKTLMKTFAGKLPTEVLAQVSYDSENNEAPNIVICVHPAQKTFSIHIKDWLMDHGFEVWCSNEKDSDIVDSDTLPPSQDSLIECSNDVTDGENGVLPVDNDYIKYFQEKADQADIVLIILSKDFTTSRTCQQQVYYCEQRKPVIPLQYEDVRIPGWLSMLIGSTPFHNIHQEGYKELLLSQINRCLQSGNKDNLQLEINDAKINTMVNHIKKSINNPYCVYISGSTKFYNDTTESICRAIGTRLAKREDITLVTGGFYGVGEKLSKAFFEQNQTLRRKNRVCHVLPERDKQDRSEQAKQGIDDKFEKVPFGESLFCGESVRERETIVAKCFDICILIEGGPGAAHEAEEFVWNDHIVIPIYCTGGAAGGKFGVPDKIFHACKFHYPLASKAKVNKQTGKKKMIRSHCKVPQGVSQSDWNLLGKKSVSPEQISQAVFNIIDSLFQNITCDKSNIPISSSCPLTKSNEKSSPHSSPITPTLTSMSTLILP